MHSTLTEEPLQKRDAKANIRIVVIDDHKLLRDGLRALLASECDTLHMAGEAGTAHEGFALVKKVQPDLVVLDLNLPDQHGTRLASEIRRAWPAIKILVLSGSGNGGAATEIARAGADGFIRKEDAAEEFLRAIPMVMSGRSYFSPAAADAIAHAMWSDSDTQAEVSPARLADRERQLLRGFAEGLGYKQIAAQMKVSVRTAETYRARLVQKLGFSSRAEMVRYAIRHGLVEA